MTKCSQEKRQPRAVGVVRVVTAVANSRAGPRRRALQPTRCSTSPPPSPALQRELDSFTEWRLKPINRNRNGVSVEPATAAGDKSDALRLLGWLESEKSIAPSLGGVFGSERLDWAVQAFMDHLRSCGRLYSTCAGYIKSFVAVARFVRAARAARAPPGTAVSTSGPTAPRATPVHRPEHLGSS